MNPSSTFRSISVKQPEPVLILLNNALRKLIIQSLYGDGWKEETAVSSEQFKALPERKHPWFSSERTEKSHFSNFWCKHQALNTEGHHSSYQKYFIICAIMISNCHRISFVSSSLTKLINILLYTIFYSDNLQQCDQIREETATATRDTCKDANYCSQTSCMGAPSSVLCYGKRNGFLRSVVIPDFFQM